MAGVHSPIAGAPICGDGTLCGTWQVYGVADPTLHLLGRTLSVNVAGGTVALFTSKPRLHLLGREYTLGTSQSIALAAAKLRLRGAPYLAYKSIGPTLGAGVLRLTGKAFSLSLSQTLPIGKSRLVLLARPLGRVGQPGLFPTTPEMGLLTPSPLAPALLLIPSTGQEDWLVGEFLVGEGYVAPEAQEGKLTPSPVMVA